MKKNDVFTFTAPKGVVVTAVVVAELSSDYNEDYDSVFAKFLCYAQNRLFTYFEEYRRENAFTPEEKTIVASSEYGEVLVDYCILPDYDKTLEAYQH